MLKRRRIFAEEPHQAAESSMSQMLFEQQLGWHGSTFLRRRYAELAVRHLGLQAAYDAYDQGSTSAISLPYMQQRSAVLEVVVHDPLLFVLANSGLCSVFNLEGGRKLCYLNAGAHDIIRSIVFNSWTSSVLAVSFHATGTSFSNQLHCKSVPACMSSFSGPGITYCTHGQAICEPVAYPGFLEFDEAAPRALLFNASTMQYKVYDLSTPSYCVLYSLAAADITEVKMSSRFLLLVKQPQQKLQQQQQQQARISETEQQLPQASDQQQQQQQLPVQDVPASSAVPVVPLEVISSASGSVVCRHELPAAPVKAFNGFDVLELFDDMLLVKQPMQAFKIYNVLSMSLQGSSDCESLSQVSSFLYLRQQHLFMTVSYHTLITWNFKAQVVACFEDHDLWYPDNRDDPLVYITQDWVVSYCRPKGSNTTLPAAGAVGSIHISSVVTGKLIAKLEAQTAAEEDVCEKLQHRLVCQSMHQQHGRTSPAVQLNTHAALTDVTALVYDETQHVIYTGHRAGVVHKWAPG